MRVFIQLSQCYTIEILRMDCLHELIPPHKKARPAFC